VLPRPVRQRLQRAAGEHRDVAAAPFVADHLGVPHRRLGLRRRARLHPCGDDRERLAPRVVVLLAPLPVGQVAQGLEQAAAEQLVVRGGGAVLAVVPPEPAQVAVQPVRVVQVLDGRDDRGEQSRAGLVHLHREQIAQLRVGQEHPGVELAGHTVLTGLDQSPALLQRSRQITHIGALYARGN
jgi:hypothetical protein